MSHWLPQSHELWRELTAATTVPAAAWTKPTLASYDGDKTLVLSVAVNQQITRVMASREDAERLSRLLNRAVVVTDATWWVDEYPPHTMVFRFDLGAPQGNCW